jgi:hypothetical protein
MHMSAKQMQGRDRVVENVLAAREAARAAAGGDQTKREAEVQAICMQHGSKGRSEHDKSQLGYWHVRMHSPFAVYHCLYLGIAKDFMSWLLVRIGAHPKPKDQLIMPFGRPKDTHRLLQARRGHFVLRNKPDCIMVDFTQNLGSMTMSEMQLLYEVGAPYFCHDLTAFGVPPEAVTMWLLLRHGMLLLTRLVSDDAEGYREQLKEAQACLVAFAATAEHVHSRYAYGASQFKFTWKLHVACGHLRAQAEDSGHSMQASDTWVEQLMRQKACQICKCALASYAGGVSLAIAYRACQLLRACMLYSTTFNAYWSHPCSKMSTTCMACACIKGGGHACAGTGRPRTQRTLSS